MVLIFILNENFDFKLFFLTLQQLLYRYITKIENVFNFSKIIKTKGSVENRLIRSLNIKG